MSAKPDTKAFQAGYEFWLCLGRPYRSVPISARTLRDMGVPDDLAAWETPPAPLDYWYQLTSESGRFLGTVRRKRKFGYDLHKKGTKP